MKNAGGTAKTLLKIGLVAALFVFLYKKGFISFDQTRRAFTEHAGLTIPAMLAMFFTAALGAVRWQWLLHAQDIRLPWSQTFKLTFIGNFFNIALPGAVSGDFVKAFYVANAIQGQKGRAFGTILFDRIVGLSALVLVSATALALDIDVLKGTPLLKAVQTMMGLAAFVVVAFYAYLLLLREKYDPLMTFLKGLSRRTPKAASLVRIYEGVRHYHHHRWTVIRVLLLSMLIHIVVGFSCMLFTRALEIPHIPMLPFYVVVPLGILVTAIPVAPAGVGTGHYAFFTLFRFLGTERGADIFSLFALTQLLVGAVGGLVYLRYKHGAPQLDMASGSEPNGAQAVNR